jgi:hypothetical protein
VPLPIFASVEVVCIAAFTLDYLLRLLTCYTSSASMRVSISLDIMGQVFYILRHSTSLVLRHSTSLYVTRATSLYVTQSTHSFYAPSLLLSFGLTYLPTTYHLPAYPPTYLPAYHKPPTCLPPTSAFIAPPSFSPQAPRALWLRVPTHPSVTYQYPTAHCSNGSLTALSRLSCIRHQRTALTAL